MSPTARSRRNSKTSVQKRNAKDFSKAIFRLPTAWIIAVLILTFLAYLPALKFEYVYDDVEQIVKNPHIQSWQYLPNYFTQSLWSHGNTFQVRFYRPFFLLWLLLNYTFFELQPAWWHFTTLLCHLCVTFCVYLIVRKLSNNWIPAVLSALLFGLHPVHIQVAAWISSVSESLLAFMLLASLMCYMKSSSRKRGWLVTSMAFYVSALLIKETAASLPALIFVYAWLWHEPQKPMSTRVKNSLFCALPYLGITAAYLLVRVAVLHAVIAESASVNASTLLFTLPSIILAYAKLFLWPTRLSPMYETVLVTHPGWTSFLAPCLILFVLGIGTCFLISLSRKRTGLVLIGDEDRKLLLLGFSWTILFLLPALYLPALQNNAFIQDRYLYLPSIGLTIVAGLIITRFGREGRRVFGLPRLQIAVAAVLMIFMLSGVREEIYVWKNNLSLFTRAVERAPDNMTAKHDLAAALLDAGRYDESIALLRGLLSSDPNDYVDNNNLGQAYLKKGDRLNAEHFLAKSCQVHPAAGCFYQLGAIRFNLGRMDVSEQAFSEAIALAPGTLGYHFARGLALERTGNNASAIEAFRQELALNPGDARAKNEIERLAFPHAR